MNFKGAILLNVELSDLINWQGNSFLVFNNTNMPDSKCGDRF